MAVAGKIWKGVSEGEKRKVEALNASRIYDLASL